MIEGDLVHSVTEWADPNRPFRAPQTDEMYVAFDAPQKIQEPLRLEQDAVATMRDEVADDVTPLCFLKIGPPNKCPHQPIFWAEFTNDRLILIWIDLVGIN